ncbi:MAG: M3 family oligoendopeptidase [Ruthenibacterium sp.]
MIKLHDMPYLRPAVDETLAFYAEVCTRIKTAQSAKQQLAAFADFEQRARQLATMGALASIRHTVDTRDAFYEAENDFFDANAPAFSEAGLAVYRALLASPWRAELSQTLGALAFEKMEVDVKASSPDVLVLMAEENALTTAYEKLYASAQIDFDGKKNTVSQMSLYKQSPDRAVRKAACEAEGAWFDSHAQELDALYDKLVKNRTAQAHQMGYENFIPLGAVRMRRVGYTLADMADYRAQIKRDVVPAVAKLKAAQAARTHIADPKFYDDAFCFADGNPAPHGTPDEIMAAGKQMYHSLAPQTAAFIDEMFDADVFDVLSKDGKAPGGYCTYLPDYKLPFIFSNFNATSDDVDVLTHEAGHAFAAYVAAQKNLPVILEEPGMESCEIHSMSMEFLTSEYHHLFFGADTDKYELAHAEDALCFLPYGTMVDEFQHLMYANPNLTPAQRNETWAKLETQYRPWLDFAGLPFYGRGAGWQRQLHIYEIPFYYLDYCLAQSVALQFFLAQQHDWADAWQRYLALVDAAGTRSYPGLVAAAGFDSPFRDGTMKKLADGVSAWIEQKNKELLCKA